MAFLAALPKSDISSLIMQAIMKRVVAALVADCAASRPRNWSGSSALSGIPRSVCGPAFYAPPPQECRLSPHRRFSTMAAAV